MNEIPNQIKYRRLRDQIKTVKDETRKLEAYARDAGINVEYEIRIEQPCKQVEVIRTHGMLKKKLRVLDRIDDINRDRYEKSLG